MGENGRERAPPTLPRETSEKKRPTASMSASAPIASDFRYSGKKPTARQDSLKVMRPDEGWVCEVEPANETQGPVIRSTLIGKGTPPSTYEGCATLYEIFERSVRLYPDNPCLGSRLTNEDGTPTDYKWMSYKEVSEKTTLLASGLLADAILPQDKIGVFGANSPEWFLAMQACNRVNAACVPLYDTLGENAVEYILNHAECKTVFVSSAKLSVYWGTPDKEATKALGGLPAKTKATSFADL